MEKKEIKISLGTFVVGIIAIVLLILVICMGMYILNNKENNLDSNNSIYKDNTKNQLETNKTENTEKVEQLDINSALVQKLYGDQL